MSSTNRSNLRDSHLSDYYITPAKPIEDLFSAMKKQMPTRGLFESGRLKSSTRFLDPCAGGDGETAMSYPVVINSLGVPKRNIQTIDIRKDSRAAKKADFLRVKSANNPDVIITNPPFHVAEEVVLHSPDLCRDAGLVIMLLRLNFFGSQKRKSFWANNMPLLTFVHSERISFIGGQTDSVEYMHCVRKKGVRQNHTKLVII